MTRVPLPEVGAALKGGSVAIGNFDGVHRGHQRVLSGAIDAGRPALALTFEPHPRDHFGRGPVFRLTPPDMKAKVIAALGLDATVEARFEEGFAALSADAFVERVLVEALGARTVLVGADFSYGARRSGTVDSLTAAGATHGFAVRVVGEASEGGAVISSSRVREHLAGGDVEAANTLLGYRYRVRAPVLHGEKRGRTMGYPTTNQALDPVNGLRQGIYAVRVLVDADASQPVWRGGVASFGRRPTFDNGAPLLETFIFDHSGDLYGRELTVAFVRFLRSELRFDTMEDLIVQMNADAGDARSALDGLAPISPLDAALDLAEPASPDQAERLR